MAIDRQYHRMGQGALGLAINTEGKFLLTLRNEPRFRLTHRKWQIPGGGIEFEESPETALKREIKEELGVEATIIHPQPFAKTHVWRLSRGHHHILLLCYLISIGDQEIHLDQKENLEYRWINFEELASLDCLPLTYDFIRDAQQLIAKYSIL